jgi:hypothetical protein
MIRGARGLRPRPAGPPSATRNALIDQVSSQAGGVSYRLLGRKNGNKSLKVR